MRPWEPICLVHLEVNNCQRSPGRNWAGRALRISQPHHQWWSMAKRRCRVGYYKLENSHGIWKSTVWKGKSLSSSKPPFLGSMLVWGGVDVLEFSRHFLGWIWKCSECREDMQGHFERILPKMTLQRFTKATLVNLYDLNLTKIWCCSVLIHAILYFDLALRPAREVVTPDVLATNGVVHIIDHVLLGTLKLRHTGLCKGHEVIWGNTHAAPWHSPCFTAFAMAQGFYDKILGHKILGFAPFTHLLDFWKEGDQSEWVEVIPTGGGPVFLWHDAATFVCCHQQSVWKDAECIGPGHVFVVWKMIIFWQRGLVRRSDRCCFYFLNLAQAWARQTGMSQHVNLLQLNAFTGVRVGSMWMFFFGWVWPLPDLLLRGRHIWVTKPQSQMHAFLAQCVCR